MPRRPSYDRCLDAAERAAAAADWAAAAGHVLTAMEILEESGTRRDVARLVRIAEAAAPHDHAVAYNLAGMKITARHVRSDRKGAEALLRRLAHSDDIGAAAMAHAILGNIMAGDYGGRPDLPRALRHFEQSARLGAPGAAYNAGVAHRYGIGTAVDLARAERLLRQAFETERAGPYGGPNPGLCIELATLQATTGVDESMALETLNACLDPTPEIGRMRDAILGDDDRWDSGEDFARDHERRTSHRMAMDDVLARCSAFDRAMRGSRALDAERIVDFAETFMGWDLDAADPLAGLFGDFVAEARAGDGARFPVFAVSARIDGGADPMLARVKAAIARRHRDAVVLSPMLCVAQFEEDEGALLGFGLLLRRGRWSMFALAPGGFDRVLAEAGDLDRDPRAYCAAHGLRNIDPGLPRWMLEGGRLHDMMRASGIEPERRRWKIRVPDDETENRAP